MTTSATPKHPRDLGPVEVSLGLATFAKCPDCGQIEVWLRNEISDHGQCRSKGPAPCPVCGEEPNNGPT